LATDFSYFCREPQISRASNANIFYLRRAFSLHRSNQLLPENLDFMTSFGTGIRRRFERMRRRRKIGRAYDMALEIARTLPPKADVLDVGCGNGFIAHHLVGILRSRVVGLDVGQATVAPIDYLPYDGRHFPLQDQSFDAVLLCYVLHHAQDARVVLNEVARVLHEKGLAIIYEDIPTDWWDRIVCWIHNLQWHKRTGPCTFRMGDDWRHVFNSAGFEVVRERRLSRWRNFFHPVSRQFFVLRLNSAPCVVSLRDEKDAVVNVDEAYLAA
jgi:ubiquinone/menaquinone biosynthesis C-methylase UbiE